MRPAAISHLQVGAQLAGVVLAVWPWPVPERGPLAALAVCALGAALGIVTLAHNRIGNFGIYPEPKATARLVTTGPYALIRHPMYTALVTMMAGIALWNTHWLNVAGLVLLSVAVVSKAVREERFLRTHFDDYDDYRRRTRWFVPYLL